MNLIILAAGKGNRMGVITRDKPKLLISLGGTTLLERQLNSIQDCSEIKKIYYVIGYMADAIEIKLQEIHLNNVYTIFNPFFDISNNLISLWLAKHCMDEDFAITNGDNLFERKVIQELCESKNGIFLGVNKKEKYDNDDMKVILRNNTVERVSKLIDENKADYESVGFAVISGENNRYIFKNKLESMVRSRDYFDKYWLEVFNLLAKDNVPITPLVIKGKWQEFDYHKDIDIFNFLNNINQTSNNEFI